MGAVVNRLLPYFYYSSPERRPSVHSQERFANHHPAHLITDFWVIFLTQRFCNGSIILWKDVKKFSYLRLFAQNPIQKKALPLSDIYFS
jgi:hypothetical protein